MFISIIIPVYKNYDLLNTCLRSLCSAVAGEYEIIVVGDGVTPVIAHADSNIISVTTSHTGPAGARNKGAIHAKGDILFFLDSDIIISKHDFDRIVSNFEIKDIDALFGIYSSNCRKVNFWSDYKNLYWHFNQIGLEETSHSLNTAVFVIRRDCFFEVGCFNGDSLIGEDREFGEILAHHQKKIYLDKEIIVEHHRNFTFSEVIIHHFNNIVNLTILMLRQNLYQSPRKDVMGARMDQIKAIILSVLIICALFVFMIRKDFTGLMFNIILCTWFFYLEYPFVNFCRKRCGIKFAGGAFLMSFVECITSCLGIFVGVVRFYIFKNAKLNFKLRSSL